MIRESVQPSAREQGIIHFYSPEQGRGFISARSREYQFGLTDIVGTLKPEQGDRVEFSTQLVHERQLARKVVLARNPQFIDFYACPTGPRRALDLNRPALLPTPVPLAPREGPEPPLYSAVYLRCQACHRLVKPRRVRSRRRLSPNVPRWLSYCPLCKTRQLERGVRPPRRARQLLGWLLAGLLVGIGLGLL